MSKTEMGRKKLQIEKKSFALTLLEMGESVIAVVRHIEVSREAIYQLKRSAAASLSPWMVPKRKSGSGGPKKTFPKTDKLLKREVLSYPSISAVELKKHVLFAPPERFDQDNLI